MAVLSMASQWDKSKLASGDAWIILLDLVWNNEHVRLARNVDPVQFDAGDGLGIQTYQPFAFEVKAEQTATSQLPTISIAASNVMRMLQGLIEQYGGLAGANANLYVYNTAHPAGEPDLAISTTVMSTNSSAEFVNLTCSAASPMRSLFPKFLYRATFCMWVSNYKGKQCGYTGTITNCDGTYSGANGCLVHDNATRFGAFPGIGTNGIALAAQN
jgi:phage-related protein